MAYQTLRHADCPVCGLGVTRFSVLPDDELHPFGDVHRVSRTSEIRLWPCGHDVHSYTIDMSDPAVYIVTWNTL